MFRHATQGLLRSFIFVWGMKEAFGGRGTDRHSKELDAHLADAVAVIRATPGCSRRCQLCIKVEGRHFQQDLWNNIHYTAVPTQSLNITSVKSFMDPKRGTESVIFFHIKKCFFYLL